MPQGVTITAADGKVVEVTDVRRLPDDDGLRVWLARIPAGTRVSLPLQFGCQVLPGLTEVRFDLSGAVPVTRAGQPAPELTGQRGLVGFFRSFRRDLSAWRRPDPRRPGE